MEEAKILFVSATGTGVGKSFVSTQIIEHFGKMGLRVGAFKPLETGVNDMPADASLLLDICKRYNPAFEKLSPKHIVSYSFKLPAAPFCADKEHTVDICKIIKKCKELSKMCDLLVVEGAGGLHVPILRDTNMLDLAKMLKAKVLLVTPSKLGCINETSLSLAELERSGLRYMWCVNSKDKKINNFNEVTKPYYDEVYSGWCFCEDIYFKLEKMLFEANR